MSQGSDSRLLEVASAFVKHMHAFAQEVRLTEAEYDIGIDFLNRIGQATNDRHNEGILFADAIGFSTLVCLLNNGNDGATETAAALLGPFWRMNSPKHGKWRLDRALADAGPGAVRELPFVDQQTGDQSPVWRSTSGSPRPSASTKIRTTARRT